MLLIERLTKSRLTDLKVTVAAEKNTLQHFIPTNRDSILILQQIKEVLLQAHRTSCDENTKTVPESAVYNF